MTMLDDKLPQLRRLAVYCTHVFRRFSENRCLMAAGALSFTSLLALVPLAAIGLALFSLFPAFSEIGQLASQFIIKTLAPQISDQAVVYFSQFLANAQRLAAPGFIILIATAIGLWFEIEAILDEIWNVRTKRPLMRRLMSLWMLLLPVLGPLLLGIILSILGRLLESSMIATFLPVVLEITGFSLLYFLLPRVSVRLAHAAIGGVIAGLLFETVKIGFGVYVTNFNSYETIYGALSALPMFLIWMYVSWVVALFGAVVTAELPKWKEGPAQ